MATDTTTADVQLISRTKPQWEDNNCRRNVLSCEHKRANVALLLCQGDYLDFYCHGNIFCHVPLGKIAVMLIIVCNLRYVRPSEGLNTVFCRYIVTGEPRKRQ